MTDATDRWRRVEALCQAALERPPAERDAFLRGVCSDDALRREVEMLLARESAADRFLETGVGAAAARVLSGANAAVSGRKIGAFEVGPMLGAGAMGEVFRARDVDLDREVALKVLPAAFAVDPDRLARFKREAQVLAALNHPNIASIYGFEGSGGMQALVLELVEGPTLADRIVHGPVPVEDALPIARQIAEGLEAAHEQGIVHRDLKPANIKQRPDGTVKVLDFGLAKVLEQEAIAGAATVSPTITTRSMVQRGVLLGTAAYMSPEQARGHPADKRSDVWAFGVVLYEMLAGHVPFRGNDVAETLAAVLRQDIDWTALPAATPQSVRRLIARCLDRDVNHRLRDIGQARLVLEDSASSIVATRSDLPTDRVAVVPSGKRPSRRWRRAIPLALSAIVTAAAAATAWYLKPSSPLQVARLSFNLLEGQSLSSGDRSVVSLSPDGTQIAYAAASGLYLRPLSSDEAKPIRGADGALTIGEPVFSPDGQSIVFAALSDRTLKRIPVAGGVPVTVCQAGFAYGLSWGPDGILFVDPDKGIMRVDPDAGTPTALIALEGGEAVQRPQMLPGGQHVLFTLATGSGPDRWDRARVVVQSVTSRERKTLFENGADARYLPTGHIVYAVGGSLFAVAFDLQRLEVRGPAVSMIEGVRRSGVSLSLGGAQFSVSSNGSLVYVPGAVSGQWDLGLTDQKGDVTPFNLLPGLYEAPRVSPDGQRVAFGSDDGKEAAVWIFNRSSAQMTRLTYGGNNRFPIWSSDGKHVVFQSDRDGDRALFWQLADGSKATRLTTPNAGEAHEPESWSPKDDWLLYSVTKGSDVTLSMLSLASKQSTPFGDVHSTVRTGAMFSPDGRWVAYATTEASKTTIYVQPFPATGFRRELSPKGGEPKHPVWSADGGRLFYNPGPGRFESVSVTTHPTFAFGNPVPVPRPFPGAPPSARRPYDITTDDKFVSAIPAGRSRSGRIGAQEIEVVLNWFEELRTRVPLPQ